ncbi:MAG: hypothetical protein IJK98_01225 [Clostridia bacterium]|nr:hypothetical protein [Clostridia bacterium]
MTESRTSHSIKNAAASLSLRIVSVLSQFLLRTVFLRVLGNGYTGVSGLFTDVLNVLLLAQASLETAMNCSLYRPVAENDAPRVAALVRWYHKGFRLASAGMLAVGALCVPFLGRIVGDAPEIREDIRLIFLLFTGSAAFSCWFACRPALLKAAQRSRTVSLYGVAAQTAECLLSLALLLLFRRYLLWLALHVAVNAARALLLWKRTKKEFPSYLTETPLPLSPGERRGLQTDWLCLAAYQLSGAAVYSTDSVFIAALFGAGQVAVTGNYLLIVNSVRGCLEQLFGAVRSSVGHLAATDPPEKQLAVFRRLDLTAYFAACWGAAALFTLLDPFVGELWLGEAYRLPAAVTALLAVNFYLAVMVYPVETFRAANGLFRQGWGRSLATAALNLLLDWLLGRRFGLAGIFAATALSRAATQVWFDPLLVFRRAFRADVKRYYAEYTARAALAAVISAATFGIATVPVFSGVGAAFLYRFFIAATVPGVILCAVFCRSKPFRELIEMARRVVRKGNRDLSR